MYVTIWGSCAGPLLNRHSSRGELCLGSKGLGGALPPTVSQGGALLLTMSQGVGGPRRHSCVACLEALPKIPLPSKTQGKPSCCIPRDRWWVRAVGVGLSAAVECPWAACTPLTLLGGMVGERIHRMIDVAFPISMVRWALMVKIRFTGMVFPLHLNMSRAFPTHL